MVKKKRTNLKIFIITMIITITILLILLKIAYCEVSNIISYAAIGIFLLMPVIIVTASILNYYKLKKIHENDDESVKDRLGQNRNKWFAVAGIWVALIIVAGGYIVMSVNFSSVDKPIIYIYPEEEMEVSVKVGYPDKLTHTYPKYQDEWKVIAKPDGSLVDIKTGRNLYALYWEGKNTEKTKVEEGFVVKGEDTISFLEEKLEILGLNEREANEFIIYWLPKLENNKYNYIRFETEEEINRNMPLYINPKPESLIRVMMEYKPLNKKIEVKEQKLETPKREGYTVVEWGGTEIK